VEPIALTTAELATVTEGQLLSGTPDRRIERISIDSRSVSAGDLFIAIRGDRFDGHEFVTAALAAGAAGAVVTQAPAAPEAGHGRPAPILLQVRDTTRALQDIAREMRRRSGAKVIAITGSAGKTTTKELTAEFLSAKYSVFRNKGNLNNHIGLPLSLLELRSRPEIAVVELGMNHPGEISTLVGIAEPDVRVWTNVGDAHLGFFASADAIADAKAEILERARPTDLLVANADDPRVMAHVPRFAGRTLTFGVSERADVRATDVEHRGLAGVAANVINRRGEVHISSPLLGLGNLSNVLAAAAVAFELGIALDTIAGRAASMRPAAHRGALLRLPGGITLIDDSYNSSPSALKQSLATVGAATGSARKIAVLGEMLELGIHATRLHRECGRAAAQAGLQLLITVGGDPARQLADAAREAGLPETRVVHVATSAEAAELALKRVRPGDLVLVKGSRGIRTDTVVERLKVEFA
jgi:UDP-N-acetylmuramoyl-tripeptide--D-alanyl-D-alanine ligase